MTLLAVLVGGALGAPVRYLLDQFFAARAPHFPWGTLAANLAASFLLGIVVGAGGADGWGEHTAALVGPGFCGALSTYSTFAAQTLALVEEDRLPAALANIAGSVVAGVVAAAVGVSLGAAST